MTDTRRLPWQLENRIRTKHADTFFTVFRAAYREPVMARGTMFQMDHYHWALKYSLDLIISELYRWDNTSHWSANVYWVTADMRWELRLFKDGKTVAVYQQQNWRWIGFEKALEACGVQPSYMHWPDYASSEQQQPSQRTRQQGSPIPTTA